MSLGDPYETGFDEENGKTITADECPECAGGLETEGGEITCRDCGLIVNEYWINHAATARSFSADETKTKRTGAPLTQTRHDRGLSTEIGYKWDGNGNQLSGKTRRQFRRLRQHQNRARWSTKAEQNLAYACGEIARMTSALGLGWDVREQASALYREAMAERLIRGRSIEGVAAACIYAVCRCAGRGRELEEIVSVARVSESAVKNGYRAINTELGLETALIRPRTLLPRLISELQCDVAPATRRRAHELACQADTAGIANGRRPSGVAAACLYLAAKETGTGLTQEDVATTAGTTATTLRCRYRELEEVLD
jgi:transcription initiation factor TFIIB